MLSLRDLQARFGAHIDALVGGEEGTATADSTLLAHVVADGLQPRQRLGIYANNVSTSLTGALRDVYPAVAALVGAGFFGYLASAFLARHPSRSGNLHDFGAELADFLAAFEAAASLPYLPDVARLEWAWHRAYHAAEHPPLALADLAAVDAAQHEHLRFALHPSVTLLRSDYPFVSIWAANVAAEAQTSAVAVALNAGPEQALIIRGSTRVEVHGLGVGELALLRALTSDSPLAAACETAVAVAPDLDIGACVQRHVTLGTLASFRL